MCTCLYFGVILCFCVCVFACVNGESQTGRLDVAENFQNRPEQSACPSTTPALKHTQDKLILQSLALSAPTYQNPQTPPLPPPFLPLAHTFPPSPSLLSRFLIDRVLCKPSFRPPFVSVQIINGSISQTVHIHFLPQAPLCGVTECKVFTSSMSSCSSDMEAKFLNIQTFGMQLLDGPLYTYLVLVRHLAS